MPSKKLHAGTETHETEVREAKLHFKFHALVPDYDLHPKRV